MRKESRSGSNQGPSAYQPSALPVGHTGSQREERKHLALRPQKPLRLIRDGEVGGSEILYLTPTRYSVSTTMILVGSCVIHFNVSLIVWAKSHDNVHKPHFLREENRGQKRIEPRSFCLPAKRLTARPHRLTNSFPDKFPQYVYA